MSEPIGRWSIRTNSVEELTQLMRGSFWDLHMRQISVGKAPAAIDAIATSSSLLLKTELAGRTHQLGNIAGGSYTFGLPLKDQAPIKFGSRQVGADTLTLFDSTDGLDCVSEANFGAFTASFNAPEFETLVHKLGLDISTFGVDHGSRHVRLPVECAQSLRESILEMLSYSPAMRPVEAALQQLEVELVGKLASALVSTREPIPDNYKNRARALRVALDYIHNNLDAPLTVVQLCEASACSISTLERAFRERFAMSPKRYLMAVRLSGVRRALLASGEDEGVGDIAAGMGFWHMSKMAADYKRMFGELPSRTRRAA